MSSDYKTLKGTLAENLDTQLTTEEIDLSPTKIGPRGSGYGPIMQEYFDLNLEQHKKSVIHFTLLAIVLNTILFFYVGPTPFGRLFDVESHSISVAFYVWDVILMIISIAVLLRGLSKRAILSTSDIKSYKMNMLIVSGCQILNGLLVIIEAGALHEVVISLFMRIIVVAVNLMVWRKSKELEMFYRENKPVFI
jgi:hypothetical protein